MVKRYDVFLVNLDRTPSDDPKNTRPAVVASPDELNRNVESVIIAPLSSTNARYPTRIPVDFLGSERFVILDQLQAIDGSRLVKKIGEIESRSQEEITNRLLELFA
ncbi:MAG: type II toxin-antitoxin system PemK/MazF family toxin [Pyrinomonadaceae bacterium]|nr:type II toxin-antitoxin system PemK/MazF family toxin [Pyrinomonadaceae bacterium]